jgi:hypothetical protein
LTEKTIDRRPQTIWILAIARDKLFPVGSFFVMVETMKGAQLYYQSQTIARLFGLAISSRSSKHVCVTDGILRQTTPPTNKDES